MVIQTPPAKSAVKPSVTIGQTAHYMPTLRERSEIMSEMSGNVKYSTQETCDNTLLWLVMKRK